MWDLFILTAGKYTGMWSQEIPVHLSWTILNYCGLVLLSWGAEWNLLDFTDPSLPVKHVLRRKPPSSTVNEERSLRNRSGRTYTPSHYAKCSEMMKHLFSFFPAPEILRMHVLKLGENSYISLCWLGSTWHFCFFRFVDCDHTTSSVACNLLMDMSWFGSACLPSKK